MSDAITNATDANFEEEVLNADGAILVDFWAPWCGPCKMIAPLLDEVAASHAGKVKVVKVNVDESQEVPAKYGVRGIPTLAIFKGGQVVGTKVGALSKPQLEEFVNDNV